jgi:hypothetical protein
MNIINYKIDIFTVIETTGTISGTTEINNSRAHDIISVMCMISEVRVIGMFWSFVCLVLYVFNVVFA